MRQVVERIIKSDRSIIPACDVPLDVFESIVRQTGNIEKVGGYKVGFLLGLNHGLAKVVEIARKHTDKPIIYDHQKAGTDIPDMGGKFAKLCKDAGIDAVILFPQAGYETHRAWVEASHEQGLGVIVGGLMTHKGYLRSEGGYIVDEAVLEIYGFASDLDVTHFVVPGNKPESIRQIRKELERLKTPSITFYAPGFVAQGGNVSEAARVAGDKWHAIVGRGIYEAEDKKTAALELTSQL